MANDPQPIGRRGRAHQFQSFAAPPVLAVETVLQPLQPVYPDQLRGRPARAHEMQFLAKPGRLAVPTVLQPLQPVTPSRLPGRRRRAHEFQFLAKPGKFVTPVVPFVPGVGAVGAATFVLSLEPGTKVTYSWQTTVISSYDGSEQRESTISQPRRRFDGAAFLVDAGFRDLTGTLQRAAAQGSTFLLALSMEEILITADSVDVTVTVESTAGYDWVIPGQRCVVAGTNGTTVNAIVQSSTATTITIVIVDSSGNFTFNLLGTTGLAGGRIMPLVQVLLEPQQGFARFPVAVGLWTIRATANVYGFAGVDSMGIGTSITTITAGEPVPVEDLEDDDLLIWDRVNAIDGTGSESMLSRTELVDLGGMPFSIGGAAVPDWGRSIRMRSASRDDFQWLKAFIHHLRGRQGAFLLPTNRPDLVFVSTISGGIKVASASTAGGNDYVSWFASDSHQRLAITAGGVVQYASVASMTDNLDGTLSLLLDTSIDGTITQISFLEQVRLDSDDVEVSWDGSVFSADLGVVSVQETIIPPLRFIFDTVIDVFFSLPGTIKEVAGVAFGTTTLVNVRSDFSKTLSGIAALGGNVDGMVVCICTMNTDAAGISHGNENTNSAPENRMRHSNGGGGVGAADWYRYNGTLQRWYQFMKTG